MLFADGSLFVIFLLLWLFCLFDVITTDASAVRNLPKLLWLLIVVLLFDIGSILWLIAGRPWNGKVANLPYKGNAGSKLRMNGTNPDDDEEFLRGLRERAERQRRAAREQPHDPEAEDGTPQ